MLENEGAIALTPVTEDPDWVIQLDRFGQACPACAQREWIENLKGTALWLRLTTAPALIAQLRANAART